MYRIGRRIEDKDIAPNTYSCFSRYGQKVVPVHYAGILCTGTTFCPYRLDRMFVFGAMSSSSILGPILYKTYYSMVSLLNIGQKASPPVVSLLGEGRSMQSRVYSILRMLT